MTEPTHSPERPEPDDIPAGDSPPKARWPLILAAAAWGAWMLFLGAMLIVRLSESPRG